MRYSNYYRRDRPRDFPLFQPMSGAGLATMWAVVLDLPITAMIADFIFGHVVPGWFAIGMLVGFPVAIYLWTRIYFTRTYYATVWEERAVVHNTVFRALFISGSMMLLYYWITGQL